jgi:hypothetical protein
LYRYLASAMSTALGGYNPMSNETVESAPSQPAEVSNTEAKSDAPKKSNLSVAQAAQRLLNIESENAKAQRPTEQAAETPAQASDNSVNPDEATAESAEPSQEAETPDGEADVPSQDITPELQKKIDKRIGKEVAKRKALESRLAQLEAKIGEQSNSPAQAEQSAQKAAPAQMPANVPLAQIDDFQSLSSLQQQAKEAKRFAQDQLDRDDFEPIQIGDTVLGRSELKAILRNAEKTLDDDIPARSQFLTQKQQSQQVAHQMFPYLKDKNAPEYVLAQQALSQMPWMKNLPNADWIIGVQIEGLRSLEAKQKAAKTDNKPKPAMSNRPPSSQTVVSSNGGDVRMPSAAKSASQIEALRSQLSRKGGVTANEAAAFLLAKEKAKFNR